MSRGWVNESWVLMLLLCRGGPGRCCCPDAGDGCRSEFACELMLIHGDFLIVSDSCKLVVVFVVDMMIAEDRNE